MIVVRRGWLLSFFLLGTLLSTPQLVPAESLRDNFPHSPVVRIMQDSYGLSHVLAETTTGAYWGFGYCLARDRMLQLELLRRTVQGTLAEILGPTFLEIDVATRREGVSTQELREGLARTSPEFSDVLQAFTAGINTAVSHCRQGRLLSDPGFKGLGIEPSPFTEVDILAIFAGTMAARYNDFSLQLDNLHFLSHLVREFGARKASQIFEDVVFFEDRGVYTTLGAGSRPPGHAPGVPHLPPSSFEEPSLPSPTLQKQKSNRLLKTIGVPDKSGSYAVVFSNRRRGRPEALLFGGPQMGYFKPSAVYAIGLHTPKFDLVGTTPAGYFCLLFGANRRLGFTATAGVAHQVDLVFLKPDGADPDLLHGAGFSLRKTRRQETFRVLGERKPHLREIEETALGPVVGVEKGIHYVKSRAWKNLVVDSYQAWFDSNHAVTLDDWLVTSDRLALSINWLGADRMGHIAYVHCGLGKNRRTFGDDRLPVPRPDEFPFPNQRLSGKDPKQGFFANWNCPPVDGFRNGDMQTFWGADQRTRFLADLVGKGRNDWSVAFLRDLDMQVACTDLRWWFFHEELEGYLSRARLDPAAALALDALRAWDGRRCDEDGDGLLDHPGAGLFDAFWGELVNRLFASQLGSYLWMIGSDPTWTQTALLSRALRGTSKYNYRGSKTAEEIVASAFLAGIGKVSDKSGNLQRQKVPPMEFPGVNHAGVPTQTAPASFTPFHNRGSDVQIMTLNPAGIHLWGSLPPGNTANGKHAENQIEDYRNFIYQARPLLPADITPDPRGLKMLRPADQ